MQLLDSIIGPNGRNLQRLSKGLNLSDNETSAVLHAVMPEISHYLERNTLSRGGLAEIIHSMGDPEQRKFLEPEKDLTSDDAVSNGNALLGRILHTKYKSRAMADYAERETGVPAAKVRRMLPRIANVSMGALAEQTSPGLEDIFKRFPGFPGGKSGAGSRSGGSSTSDSPLPIPDDNWGGGGSDRNSYDDLSDVLTRRQRPLQSNPLWNIARQILGSVLGFQSKGIMGYIIRFIVYRYGWSILRMIFGRMFRV